MPTINGAFIKEQGVQFGIVIVQPHILEAHDEANRLIGIFRAQIFSNHPVVLMATNKAGHPTYYGRTDIVNFLGSVSVKAIPWQTYNVNLTDPSAK
jgi:hypothetical protein